MTALFDPIRLGGLTLKNRAALAPMTRARCPGNLPTAGTARYYAQRAGAGLIVTEGTVISAGGSGFVDCPGIWSREQVAAWQPVTQAVHDQGAAIFTQIWHVGRVSHTSLQPGGQAPVSSTAQVAATSKAFGTTADGTPGFLPASAPRALETGEIAGIVDQFATAAENAMIGRARAALGLYAESELMIKAGLYAAGSDPRLDKAVRLWPALDGFAARTAPTATDSFSLLADALAGGGRRGTRQAERY